MTADSQKIELIARGVSAPTLPTFEANRATDSAALHSSASILRKDEARADLLMRRKSLGASALHHSQPDSPGIVPVSTEKKPQPHQLKDRTATYAQLQNSQYAHKMHFCQSQVFFVFLCIFNSERSIT